MPASTRNSRSLAMLPGALAALCGPAPVRAGEFCVACERPSAQYRCTIAAAPESSPPASTAAGPGPEGQAAASSTNVASLATLTESRAQLLCITELAKSGGHESCGVSRRKAVCEGEPRSVFAPPVFAAQSGGTGLLPPAGPLPGPQPASGPPPAPGGAPQTVEELAKQTVATGADGINQAGAAVGKAGDAVAGGAESIAAGTKTATGTVGKAVTSTVGGASAAAGTFAQKSWTCLTSLFSRC